MMRLFAITTIVASLLCLTTLSAQAQGSSTYRVTEYINNVNPNESARITNSGVLITGKPGKVRALTRFSAPSTGAKPLAECGNYYKKMFGAGVNVYVAPIPLAAAYYTPNSARKWSSNQATAINAMYAALDIDVKAIDIYGALSRHTRENIYSRTDHHWAPLGAYYAAEAFAKVAGVPFRDLSHYQRVVVPNYVGSMYQFSKDNTVRTSPEEFVYHKPTNIEYTTTYIRYNLGENNRIIGESKPYKDRYFFYFRGGGAYCSFMGGDSRITQVRTATKNGRRLIIVKDSFGNAIPGYLFYSFEEIHVIDFRYFNKNIKRYAQENGITDILLASNISFACSSSVMGKYKRFVIQ